MVAPLTAYLDASGSEIIAPVWAVGGWIGTVDDWTAINEKWQAMLDSAPFRPNVEPDKRMFHASDLETCKGIYAGWTKVEKEGFQRSGVQHHRRISLIDGYFVFAD